MSRMTAAMATLMMAMMVGSALAGPNNMGPGADQVVDIWESQALTTTPIESALSYPVGLDNGITVDVALSGAEGVDTITLTPTWKIPGASAAQEDLQTSQAVTWTQGARSTFILTFSPPPGASQMYLSAVTSSTDGATITASAIGSTGAR